jgi:hypothetical protein
MDRVLRASFIRDGSHGCVYVGAAKVIAMRLVDATLLAMWESWCDGLLRFSAWLALAATNVAPFGKDKPTSPGPRMFARALLAIAMLRLSGWMYLFWEKCATAGRPRE